MILSWSIHVECQEGRSHRVVLISQHIFLFYVTKWSEGHKLQECNNFKNRDKTLTVADKKTQISDIHLKHCCEKYGKYVSKHPVKPSK